MPPVPPFLKPRRQDAAVYVAERKPDGSRMEMKEESDDSGLLACADDLIRAIHAKDSHKAAAAMRAAFEIMEAAPHEEGEHINEMEENQE